MVMMPASALTRVMGWGFLSLDQLVSVGSKNNGVTAGRDWETPGKFLLPRCVGIVGEKGSLKVNLFIPGIEEFNPIVSPAIGG